MLTAITKEQLAIKLTKKVSELISEGYIITDTESSMSGIELSISMYHISEGPESKLTRVALESKTSSKPGVDTELSFTVKVMKDEFKPLTTILEEKYASTEYDGPYFPIEQIKEIVKVQEARRKSKEIKVKEISAKPLIPIVRRQKGWGKVKADDLLVTRNREFNRIEIWSKSKRRSLFVDLSNRGEVYSW